MTLPLFILSILSLTIGYLSKDLFIGFGANFWGSSIFINPNNYTMTDIEFLEIEYKLLPLVVTLLGAFSAYYIYVFKIFEYYTFKNSTLSRKIFSFLTKNGILIECITKLLFKKF